MAEAVCSFLGIVVFRVFNPDFLKVPGSGSNLSGRTVKFNFRGTKMTAPQKYSVQEEKDRIIEGQEEEQPSLHEQINDVVFELIIQAGSLETVGELMVEAQFKQDTSCVGIIINQYTELILDRLGRIEEILSSDMREETA